MLRGIETVKPINQVSGDEAKNMLKELKKFTSLARAIRNEAKVCPLPVLTAAL